MWGPKQEKMRKPQVLRLYCRFLAASQRVNHRKCYNIYISWSLFTQTTVGQLPEVLRQADGETQPSL